MRLLGTVEVDRNLGSQGRRELVEHLLDEGHLVGHWELGGDDGYSRPCTRHRLHLHLDLFHPDVERGGGEVEVRGSHSYQVGPCFRMGLVPCLGVLAFLVVR